MPSASWSGLGIIGGNNNEGTTLHDVVVYPKAILVNDHTIFAAGLLIRDGQREKIARNTATENYLLRLVAIFRATPSSLKYSPNGSITKSSTNRRLSGTRKWEMDCSLVTDCADIQRTARRRHRSG